MVIGELDGKRTAAHRELHRLMQDFEPKAVLTDNIWGYLWGKLIYGALLFATALTNDGIADVFAERRYRPRAYGAGARGGRGGQGRGRSSPRRSTASIRARSLPGARRRATDRSFDDMVAHNRRSAKIAFGHLARSRGPQAQDRGRCADPADRRDRTASSASAPPMTARTVDR